MLPTYQFVPKNHIRLVILILILSTTLLFYYYNFTIETESKEYVKLEQKYILQWTDKSHEPFKFMGQGNSAFVKNKCKHTNCFVVENTGTEANFDAVVFNGRDVTLLQPFQMPQSRKPNQKYIFGAMESAENYPACNPMLDGYFNWTWTYRLDSNFRWGYITIYDLAGNVVGPAVDMMWQENMEPISEDLEKKLSSKTKAAAWFASHCTTKSKREVFARAVYEELGLLGLKLDAYGSCGFLSCPRTVAYACHQFIEKDYYFYLSLENSFAEDYVTEKLLTALNNYAVPVVYGGANYSRYFM